MVWNKKSFRRHLSREAQHTRKDNCNNVPPFWKVKFLSDLSDLSDKSDLSVGQHTYRAIHLLNFGEDVKKRLRLLSEVVLRTVKRRLASSFRHFLGKKMAAGFFIATRHSERLFEVKNSKFRYEIKF